MPVHARPEPAHAAADPLRVLRRDQRRRSQRRTDRASASRKRAKQRRAERSARSANASIVAPPKDYEGIRLGPYKYIEWPDGEKELYDITKDPYELNNIVRVPNYFPIRAFLHAQLVRLEACVGHTCRKRPRNSR